MHVIPLQTLLHIKNAIQKDKQDFDHARKEKTKGCDKYPFHAPKEAKTLLRKYFVYMSCLETVTLLFIFVHTSDETGWRKIK